MKLSLRTKLDQLSSRLAELDAIMDGDLDEVVTALSQEFQAEQLAALAGETG